MVKLRPLEDATFSIFQRLVHIEEAVEENEQAGPDSDPGHELEEPERFALDDDVEREAGRD